MSHGRKPNWVNVAHWDIRKAYIVAKSHDLPIPRLVLYRRRKGVRAVVVDLRSVVGVRDGTILAILSVSSHLTFARPCDTMFVPAAESPAQELK